MDTNQRFHVLFVDDERAVLDGLRRLLRAEAERWTIHLAGSVDEAMSIARERAVDAIVSDVNMPGKSGLDLLQAVRADPDLHDVPVVMLTGCGEIELKRRALDAGAIDLLNKPVSREDLLARLRSVLELRACQLRLREHNERLEAGIRERTRELCETRNEIIWRLALAAELRDDETGAHLERVAHCTRVIAAAMGLPGDEIDSLFIAAPLHDIGKIGLPDAILRKPGALTVSERCAMQQHCRIGWRILRGRTGQTIAAPNPLLELAGDIALSHHEWWNGAGYPDSLSGEDIPLAARIVAVADVFDALCAQRSYKPALPFDQAADEIRVSAGTHFDPLIVRAFNEAEPELRVVLEMFHAREAADFSGSAAA